MLWSFTKVEGVPPKIPKPIVFINHLSELKQVYQHHKDLHIGACCTYSELLENPLIPFALKNAIKQLLPRQLETGEH
ncbi:FAD binding domain-containing protein [[Brevibacterium] frigoritolerans]|uniref:FAD binding domain-containing protein n=1 Tax=Peribacillus frigoritolerans TaxID=450367 RepID=A0A941FNP9_9BACI|nr:FAD binding domain-containing protein [Peribacillus frigoritolerans]